MGHHALLASLCLAYHWWGSLLEVGDLLRNLERMELLEEENRDLTCLFWGGMGVRGGLGMMIFLQISMVLHVLLWCVCVCMVCLLYPGGALKKGFF